MKPSKAARKALKQATADAVTVASPKRAATGDSFVNAVARLGYGTGNVADGSTYDRSFLSHNRQKLEDLYTGSWIAAKAVDTLAEDMTKRGVEIHSSADPDDLEKVAAAWKSMRVWAHLTDTIRWAKLYGGAIAVILIEGQDLSTPLRPETVGQDQFKG